MDEKALDLSAPCLDWTDASFYRPLMRADPSFFAWEWLRRSGDYRDAWQRRASEPGLCQQFSLLRFEDPGLATPHARPMWSSHIDPSVLTVCIFNPFAEIGERVDLRSVSQLVTIHVGRLDVEHILFSDGFHSLRLDVLSGTLIGCPSSLSFAVERLSEIKGPIASIRRLAHLTSVGMMLPHLGSSRLDRHIDELRAADAMMAGAGHQDIARSIFGNSIPGRRWRTDASAYRQRVQRLVRNSKRRLRNPLDPRWFSI